MSSPGANLARVTVGRSISNNIDQLISQVMWGELSGAYAVDKFGEALGVGTSEEDLWNGPGTEETLLTAGATLYVSCGTVGTTQVMQVEGLDENWMIQTGYGTLTGRTQSAIVSATGAAQLWTRVFRAYQISAVPDPVGDVYIAELDTLSLGVPDTDTKVHGYIDFSDAAQQTEKAMYTVPAEHVGLVLGMTGGIERTGGGSSRFADVLMEIQELATGATVAAPAWAPFRRIQEIDLVSTGQCWAQEDFRVPFVVSQLTNIHLRCAASSSSDIVGSFDIIVIPEEYEALHDVHA